MSLAKIKFSAFLFLSFLIVSCTQDDNGIYLNNTDDTIISYSYLEYEIFELVNEHRAEIGLNQLNILNIISKEALPHTDYMLQKGLPSHDNFGIRHLNLINNANAISVAENVAYGYQTAEAVVNAWLNSESHRSIIENDGFTDFGISTKANQDGRNYFTHIFIKR